MPRYNSRKKVAAKRERQRVRAAVPRDKRHLMHWAVRGTHDDYAKFRKHVAAVKHRAPSYIEPQALQQLGQSTRRSMLESLHKESSGGGWFSDGLSWLIDQVPSSWGLNWAKSLGQAALKPFRGDSMSEVDEQYARLVNEAYKEDSERDAQFEHWSHVPEFDSDYVTVYDNADGHRFVAVRGTKLPKVRDVAEDYKILREGTPDNIIGEELRRIMDHTKPDKTVDLGAHSLGTSLALTAFQHDSTLQDRIHQSYLYNPAFSPFSEENVTDKFEADDRVRYFIDLSDPVSVGDLGSRGPKNAVYRNNWNPITAHKLVQWGGATGLQEHDDGTQEASQNDVVDIKQEEHLRDYDHDGVPDDSLAEPDDGGDGGTAVADDYLLDFGDEFDTSGWFGYWNED